MRLLSSSCRDELGGLVSALASLAPSTGDGERIDRVRMLEEVKSACAAAQARETVDFKASQREQQEAAGLPQSIPTSLAESDPWGIEHSLTQLAGLPTSSTRMPRSSDGARPRRTERAPKATPAVGGRSWLTCSSTGSPRQHRRSSPVELG